MTLTQVWGTLVIFLVCPLLGGLPLISWITLAVSGWQLKRLGTGNISVSAAFYHGGRLAGILAVLSEALKGIAAVLVARAFFPAGSGWEMVALIALVMGRYWFGRGAGTTNVVWGYVVHDPIAAGLVFLIGGIGFTILRERRQGRISILILFPIMTALRHPEAHFLIGTAVALAFLLGWIYMKIPDDLDLEPQAAESESRSMFKFFRGDRAVRTLNDPLDARKVGQKAATLAHLKRSGYPVPPGWVLLPGDDPEPLLQLLKPSPRSPLVVRSSAIGEDEATASAAGQYETILNITHPEELQPAIHRCLASYNAAAAIQYRRDRGLPEAMMAILIQQQVQGSFSGVAFSRDPISRQGDAVVLEALPGNANRVVSGQVTPESYRVLLAEFLLPAATARDEQSWVLPDDLLLPVEGEGDVPQRLIQQVAFLARHLEARYHGIPQDIEWSYDGQTLWLLQSRPITTLLPIWTRKIAAEVIPGLIRPLTWSINRPLTCGVWGEIFTLVLGKRSRGLDFNETATLHYSRAYFNASLLGSIFRRMGLPPESLEFLTRGAKFSKPPTRSTLRNLPGLLRLLQREMRLEKDFQRDYQQRFAPALADLARHPASGLSAPELLTRIGTILALLKTATYYSILAPLSAALRKAIAKVPDHQIDNGDTPEVAALRELQELARKAEGRGQKDGETGRQGEGEIPPDSTTPRSQSPIPTTPADWFAILAETPDGEAILAEFDRILERYGYLSEVGTDIAVPTWREEPQPVRELFTQFCLNPAPVPEMPQSQNRKNRRVQQRFRLKGRVTEIYSRLLAELRWSFVALEQHWLETGLLQQPEDIFFLEFEEVRHLLQQQDTVTAADVAERIAQRRLQLERDRQLDAPYLIYGDDPPVPLLETRHWQVSERLQGIAASPGQAEGRVRIVRSLQTLPDIDRSTILVVPYTDSGWAPLLARAGGLIAEVGGRLSHGAIVAREYRIPAVMDVHNATQRLRDGQLIRIDGQQGIVEIL
jgi:pyruvate,water dikinase